MRQLPVFICTMLVMASLTACSNETKSSGSPAGPVSSVTPSSMSSITPSPKSSETPSATAASPAKQATPSAPAGAKETTAPFASPGKLEDKPTAAPASFSNEEEAKAVIEKRINETIEAIKQKDMAKLANIVHPEKGVQFSPYAYVDTAKNVRVKAEELVPLWKDAKKLTWGEYDGSGKPIELSFADYFQKFVYDHDYSKAPKIGYNKIIGKSTTSNNLFTIYPKDKFITVEYHFDGFDKQFEGQDWASLRLVFENTGTQWYLVAVVHDQWTI